MPLCGMEAPAGVKYSSVGEWCRSPAKPVAVLIGSAYPIPYPDKPNFFKAAQAFLCAVGVVTARRSRSRGVSPRKRAVRAAYERVLQSLSRHHSRPSAGGGGAFQWWGGAPGRQTGAGFMMICLLNAVTNVVLRSGPVAKRWELLLSERRGRVRPL